MSDSIWAMVIGAAKLFGMTPQAVLYDMSYANIALYSKAMPSMGEIDKTTAAEEEDEPIFDESKDASGENGGEKLNGLTSRRV